MALDGIYDRLRRHIRKMDEGSGKEREPDIYCDKTENMVKRKKCQLFEASVVMFLKPSAVFDYSVTADDLMPEFLRGVSAYLHAFGSPRRHDKNLRSEKVGG